MCEHLDFVGLSHVAIATHFCSLNKRTSCVRVNRLRSHKGKKTFHISLNFRILYKYTSLSHQINTGRHFWPQNNLKIAKDLPCIILSQIHEISHIKNERLCGFYFLFLFSFVSLESWEPLCIITCSDLTGHRTFWLYLYTHTQIFIYWIDGVMFTLNSCGNKSNRSTYFQKYPLTLTSCLKKKMQFFCLFQIFKNIQDLFASRKSKQT